MVAKLVEQDSRNILSYDLISELSVIQLIKNNQYSIQSTSWVNDDNNYYIIMKKYLHDGRELLNLIVDDSNINFQTVSRYMYHILLSVYQLHSKFIAHLDIKPENILSNGFENTVLCDFGLSLQIFPICKKLHIHIDDHVQTTSYRAPEVFDSKPFDQKADIWSLGLIFLELFCKQNQAYSKFISNRDDIDDVYDIFMDQFKEETKNIDKIINEFSNNNSFDVTSGVRSEFVDLLNNMLVIDPVNRFDIYQVINHPFFKEYHSCNFLKITTNPLDLIVQIDPLQKSEIDLSKLADLSFLLKIILKLNLHCDYFFYVTKLIKLVKTYSDIDISDQLTGLIYAGLLIRSDLYSNFNLLSQLEKYDMIDCHQLKNNQHTIIKLTNGYLFFPTCIDYLRVYIKQYNLDIKYFDITKIVHIMMGFELGFNCKNRLFTDSQKISACLNYVGYQTHEIDPDLAIMISEVDLFSQNNYDDMLIGNNIRYCKTPITFACEYKCV